MSITSRLRSLFPDLDRVIWVLFWGTFISATGRFLMLPYLTLYFHEQFGLPPSQAGLLVGLSTAAGMITGLYGGSMADRFGRKPVMLASLFLEATFLGLIAVATNVVQLGILAFLFGFVQPAFRPASNSAIADVTPADKRASAYALLRVSVNIGAAVGPTLGAFLLSISYQMTFLVTAAAIYTFAFIILLLVPETRGLAVTDTGRAAQSNIKGSYRDVLADKAFVLFVLVVTVVEFALCQLGTNASIYVKSYLGFEAYHYGLLWSINGTMVVLLQLLVTSKVKSWSTGVAMATQAGLFAVALFLWAVGFQYWVLVVGMVVLTIGEMIGAPVFMKFVAEVAPPHLRGRYMAVSGIPFGAVGLIGPYLGGLLLEYRGGLALWGTAALLCTVGAVLYSLFDTRFRESARETAEIAS